MSTPNENLHQMQRQPIPSPNTRAAGIAILASAILSIVFVALDPSASGKDAISILQSMVEIQQTHQIVHVFAMACIGGFMFGYTILSQRLGLHRVPVTIGLVSYGLGSVLMLIATVFDGFISTDIAAMFVGGAPEAVKAGLWIVDSMSIVLVDMARVAWVFQSVAAIAWSLALLRERGLQRTVGVVGLFAGALPAVAVVITGSQMSASVVVGILLAQAIWNIAAAIVLLRNGRRAQDSDALPRAAKYAVA